MGLIGTVTIPSARNGTFPFTLKTVTECSLRADADHEQSRDRRRVRKIYRVHRELRNIFLRLPEPWRRITSDQIIFVHYSILRACEGSTGVRPFR